jgi:hypothetical protein
MYAARLCIGLLAVVLCSCHSRRSLPDTSPEAEPLRWLDHADVIADFTERVEHQHDYRFVSVFAFSRTGALGLRETPEVKELLRRYGERHLDGATDVITSAEQQRLSHAASDYAKQYNILLLHYFREHPNI